MTCILITYYSHNYWMNGGVEKGKEMHHLTALILSAGKVYTCVYVCVCLSENSICMLNTLRKKWKFWNIEKSNRGKKIKPFWHEKYLMGESNKVQLIIYQN